MVLLFANLKSVISHDKLNKLLKDNATFDKLIHKMHASYIYTFLCSHCEPTAEQ